VQDTADTGTVQQDYDFDTFCLNIVVDPGRGNVSFEFLSNERRNKPTNLKRWSLFVSTWSQKSTN
jgi:hypothetical protein